MALPEALGDNYILSTRPPFEESCSLWVPSSSSPHHHPPLPTPTLPFLIPSSVFHRSPCSIAVSEACQARVLRSTHVKDLKTVGNKFVTTLFYHLSLCLCPCLSVSLSLSLSVCLSVSPSLSFLPLFTPSALALGSCRAR